MKSNSAGITEPISVSGEVDMADIGEDMTLTLTAFEGHPLYFIYIYIYQNGTLTNTYKNVSKVIMNKTYAITKPFTSAGQSVTFKIVFQYENITDIIATTETFTLSGPNYDSHYSSSNPSTYNYKYDNQISGVSFDAQGNTNTNSYTYEKAYISNGNYNLNGNSRMVNLGNYKISFTSKETIELTYCELRLYCKFKNSDLLYKNGYTSIDLDVKQTGKNTFMPVNEYKYYIDESTGMIYENYHEGCSEDLMPFFFPFSLGFTDTITYELIFSDVGIFHADYIYNGEFSLKTTRTLTTSYAGMYNYRYAAYDKELEGAVYE